SDNQGELPWPRRGRQRLQNSQSRCGGRLSRDGRHVQARLGSPRVARWRASLQGAVGFTQALQGRCERSSQRYGVCISIQNFNDIKVGDVLEAFTAEKIAADIGT